MRFSEKYGFKSVKDSIQIDSIDGPLRNRLWSLLKVLCWDKCRNRSSVDGVCYIGNNKHHGILCERLWFFYFKKPADTLDNKWAAVLKKLRQYFFECQWYEVYDFIEFVANNYNAIGFRDNFSRACNSVLEQEVSAYRFVNGSIAQITEQHEIEEIEQVVKSGSEATATHIQRALELLSDREHPDYRNSVKESISAVESFVSTTLGAKKGTLGQLLKQLEGQIDLHPALKVAFEKLYGYTSDEDGIRHAIIDRERVDFHDAKFLLVACSAFINFVIGKTGNSS